ncbi:MAG TPA: TIGR03435 family protein [Candidatus Acidoferrales bacterium]|jgi:uncharacterized protein (TIGR03435 family)|nr:TIGR03435 family protein [Candidatus Acidoferrales bacterium]
MKCLFPQASIRSTLLPIALCIASAPGTHGQQRETPAAESFDVASIKANKGDRRGPSEFSVGVDRLTARNTFLGILIMRAYNVDETQMPTNVPLLLERYDIEAKAEHPARRAEMMRMLQTLLAERFKLRLRQEKKEVSGYALVVAKGVPKLRQHEAESAADCSTRRGSDGRLIYENCSMSDLASYRLYPGMMGLSGMLGNRFIVDETGLKGNYDFELMFSWEVGGNPAEGTSPRVVNPDAPSVFTALEKQLGLKLEARRIPVEVFAIDHVEKPSEN